MSSDDVHLVDFDRSGELGRVAAFDHTLSECTSHVLHVVFVQSQFLSNLAVTEIQAHQVQAPDPLTQGLMMACEHGSRQVIKLALAVQTAIPLSAPLSVIAALLGDVRIGTVWALHAIRPSQLANHGEALFVV